VTPAIALQPPITVERSMTRVEGALEELARLEPNKYALADWLNGAYRAALALPHPGPFSLRMSTAVDVAVREAPSQREAACSDGERFVATLPSLVHVVRVHDEEGAKGFSPIDLPGATLTARGLSLLLAHYLTRPGEYLPNRLLEQRNGVGERNLVVRVLP
jgi:hypothetical protein